MYGFHAMLTPAFVICFVGRSQARNEFEYLKDFALRNAPMTIFEAASTEDLKRKAPSKFIILQNAQTDCLVLAHFHRSGGGVCISWS